MLVAVLGGGSSISGEEKKILAWHCTGVLVGVTPPPIRDGTPLWSRDGGVLSRGSHVTRNLYSTGSTHNALLALTSPVLACKGGAWLAGGELGVRLLGVGGGEGKKKMDRGSDMGMQA